MDGVYFLDIKSIGRDIIPATMCFDINRKTDIRTDIMVSGGCMVVNIIFTVGDWVKACIL